MLYAQCALTKDQCERKDNQLHVGLRVQSYLLALYTYCLYVTMQSCDDGTINMDKKMIMMLRKSSVARSNTGTVRVTHRKLRRKGANPSTSTYSRVDKDRIRVGRMSYRYVLYWKKQWSRFDQCDILCVSNEMLSLAQYFKTSALPQPDLKLRYLFIDLEPKYGRYLCDR